MRDPGEVMKYPFFYPKRAGCQGVAGADFDQTPVS
jgi:hypothetical protein